MKNFFALILGLISLSSATYADDLTAKPLSVFSQRFPGIAHRFERAKIETRWNGFFLRADTFHYFKESDSTPSVYGLWLDVRTVPLEALESASQPPQTNDFIEKTTALRFPKQQDGSDSGLLITLRYGSKCDKKAISELPDAITSIKSEAQPSAVANALRSSPSFFR